MKKRTRQWLWVVGAIVAALFVTATLPPWPRAKAQASRISTRNHVATVTMAVPSPSTPVPGK